MSTSKKFLRSLVVAGMVGPFAVAGGAPALAQFEDQHEAARDVSDKDLKAYAKAAVELQEISSKWQPKLQQAEDDQELAQMQQEAQKEMATAIQDEGLTLSQYNTIFQAVDADPSLQARLQQHLQEIQ